MLKRTQLYATDINEHLIRVAKKGIYALQDLQHYTKNYDAAGGKVSFSDYYHHQYKSSIIDKTLRNHILFSKHNLVTDGIFAEMELIMCKNVLIYFNKKLQNKVLKLFTDCLRPQGYLCLGQSETLDFTEVRGRYQVINEHLSIYQYIGN